MRKLTLKQALKTPNIAFDVTSEQLNWINKYNSSKVSDRAIAIIVKPNLTLGCLEYKNDWYSENFLPILIEIIEEESNTFNSQQEMWQWLVEGNKCLWNNKTIIGFKNGILWNFSREIISNLNTTNLLDFTKYKEPEYITVNGFQVPKPISDMFNLGETVWIPSLDPDLCFVLDDLHFVLGEGNSYIKFFFENGLCHSTKEAAIIHAKAILGYQA